MKDETAVIKTHEEWLTAIRHNMYPYIVACGSFENFTHISIIFKNEKYSFPSLVTATEALCKCLYALQSRPIAIHNIFIFFNKLIYKILEDPKSLTTIGTLISAHSLDRE